MIEFFITPYTDFIPNYIRVYEKQVLLYEVAYDSNTFNESNALIVSKYYNSSTTETSIGNDVDLFYHLIAVNTDDSSNQLFSTKDNVYTVTSLSALPQGIPEAPTNLTISSGQNSLTINWSNYETEYYEDSNLKTVNWTAGYKIYYLSLGEFRSGDSNTIDINDIYDSFNDSDNINIISITTTNTSYTHSGLRDNSIYAYRVTAYNSDGIESTYKYVDGEAVFVADTGYATIDDGTDSNYTYSYSEATTYVQDKTNSPAAASVLVNSSTSSGNSYASNSITIESSLDGTYSTDDTIYLYLYWKLFESSITADIYSFDGDSNTDTSISSSKNGVHSNLAPNTSFTYYSSVITNMKEVSTDDDLWTYSDEVSIVELTSSNWDSSQSYALISVLEELTQVTSTGSEIEWTLKNV